MSSKKGSLALWYDKIANFQLATLFKGRLPPPTPRTIFVNEDLPADYRDHKGRVKKEHVYVTNQVISSKYTIITFLPRNLLEQFRRIANLFFLVSAILQFFPKFATISPGLVILPLLIILTVTAAKDGYEDYKRHQADRQVNQSVVRVLNGGGYANANVTAGKSKTFIRGAIPTFKKKSTKKALSAAAIVEMPVLEHGAVPESKVDGSALKVVTLEDLEVEYDDDLLPRGHHHSKSLDSPHWKKTLWEDIRVGDFVKIMDNESFPADILICATSEEENVCFIETKNLDGETNLKSRNAVSGLTHLRSASSCADKSRASFHIDCDRPEANLYRLNAAVVMPDNSAYPVDLQTVLLRGAVLRNTKWVVGVVLFTGENTKIIQNSGNTPSKRSKVERQMNPQVFANLILLAIMAVVCAIADSVDEHRFYPDGAPWLYDDNQPGDNPSANGASTWALAFITFSNVIPISLYISMEVVRTLQALFIYFDKSLCYEKTNQPTLARSWNLSDDLGQIEYIFSDKTGTLTQNVMVFRQCSVNGKVYQGDEDSLDAIQEVDIRPTASSGTSSSSSSSERITAVPDPMKAEGTKLGSRFHDGILDADLKNPLKDPDGSPDVLHTFWRVLSLCHTAIASVDPETNQIEYKAQSPDEVALVQAAADVGFVFRGKEKDILRLQTPFAMEIERYEILNILDFTSARKRMSVILRRLDDPNEHGILVLTKGADSIIYERLVKGLDQELKDATQKDLDGFASEGWRTLTLAYRTISDEYYAQWNERYHAANVARENREDKVEAVADEIERELRLLGATALEDRLQDGVPEAIADLKRAGIKIWVATGDKLETAIAIGYSTNLITHDSNLIVIRGGDANNGERSVYEQMYTAAEEFFPNSNILAGLEMEEKARLESNEQYIPLRRVNSGASSIVGRNNGSRTGGYVLVIEGPPLASALKDDVNKGLLLRLAMHCEGVICCRVSPLQKALIVKLVKEGVGAMTLAIGDGANDVSMIQAADVGVGISGEEGLQAVNSSDYAIAQFRFLKRLILVHGHWSYARNGNTIVNFFYKNFLISGLLWWFQIYGGWSAQYVLDYTYLLFWNLLFMLCPPIAMGIFDRIVDADILMDVPELYHYGREGYWYNTKRFVIYFFDAAYQSVIIFFFITYAYFTNSVRSDGYTGYIYEYSTGMAIAGVMVANAYIGMNMKAWTWWVVFACSFGIVFIWVFTPIFAAFTTADTYGDYFYLFESAIFWLCIPLVFCLSLLPRYLAIAIEFLAFPTDLDIMRFIRKNNPKSDFAHDPELLEGLRHKRGDLQHSKPKSKKKGGLKSLYRHSAATRGSRADMATGVRTKEHRGFDFTTEEHGVAMQRIQSHLSEKTGFGGSVAKR